MNLYSQHSQLGGRAEAWGGGLAGRKGPCRPWYAADALGIVPKHAPCGPANMTLLGSSTVLHTTEDVLVNCNRGHTQTPATTRFLTSRDPFPT